jgi:hypothetical protein
MTQPSIYACFSVYLDSLRLKYTIYIRYQSQIAISETHKIEFAGMGHAPTPRFEAFRLNKPRIGRGLHTHTEGNAIT